MVKDKICYHVMERDLLAWPGFISSPFISDSKHAALVFHYHVLLHAFPRL